MADSESDLIKALHEVARLLHKRQGNNGTLRVTEMRRALEQAHSAVQLLLHDDKMFEQLAPSDYDAIRRELSTFESGFVARESAALKAAGIKKNAQRLVMRRVHELRKTFKPRNEDYRQDLRLHLQHLSALLDELLKQLSDAQAPTNDGKHSVQKAWPKVFNLISGAVLVSVNAKLAPFDPVTSALSSTLGGTMVSKALED